MDTRQVEFGKSDRAEQQLINAAPHIINLQPARHEQLQFFSCVCSPHWVKPSFVYAPRKLTAVLFILNLFHDQEKKIFIYNLFSDTRIGLSFSPSVCNPGVMLSSPVSMVPLTSGLSCNRKKEKKKKKITQGEFFLFLFPSLQRLAQISKIDYNNKLRSKT